jgi:predicted HicB family RNase H-like nuclease
VGFILDTPTRKTGSGLQERVSNKRQNTMATERRNNPIDRTKLVKNKVPVTVRITEATHGKLIARAHKEKRPLQQIIERALESSTQEEKQS